MHILTGHNHFINDIKRLFCIPLYYGISKLKDILISYKTKHSYDIIIFNLAASHGNSLVKYA